MQPDPDASVPTTQPDGDALPAAPPLSPLGDDAVLASPNDVSEPPAHLDAVASPPDALTPRETVSASAPTETSPQPSAHPPSAEQTASALSPPAAALSPASPPSREKKKAQSPPVSERSNLSPALRKMLRKAASPSPPRRRQALPDEQELERRGQVRGLQTLWNKLGYRYEDLQRLRNLHLSNRSLGDEDMAALSSVLDERLVQVVELDLLGNRLRDASLVALAAALQRGATPHVTHVQLSRNRIGDAGVKALATALSEGAIPRLSELYLNSNSIGHEGISALTAAAEGGAMVELTCLGLSANAIGDAGVKALVAAASAWLPDNEEERKVLPNLKELHCRGCEVGDEGLNALANVLEPRNGGLPALKSLFIEEARLRHPSLKTACSARGIRLDFF